MTIHVPTFVKLRHRKIYKTHQPQPFHVTKMSMFLLLTKQFKAASN